MKNSGNFSESSPTQRTLKIIELTARRGFATVADIVTALDIPRTTAHRIISGLERQGYIYKITGQGYYIVAPRLIELANDTLWAASSMTPAHVVLTEAAQLVTGTASMAICQPGEVAYMESVVADEPLTLRFQTGRRAPLYCTSSGKLFLANIDRKTLDRYLATGPWKAFTKKTIVDPNRLMLEIETARTQGYAQSDSELIDGVVGASVPIIFNRRKLIAVLSVSVPYVRHSLESLRSLVPDLQQYAEKIARIMKIY